jgi:uncharacterized caspase-like protein
LQLFFFELLVGGCTKGAQPNYKPIWGGGPPKLDEPPISELSELPPCSAIRPKDSPQPPCFEPKGDPDSKQRALVIGNDKYDYKPLRNPANDARGITEQLVNMGFYVTRAHNLDKQNMDKVISDFGERLSDIEVALFYYSGHGAQVEGKNFLVPTNNHNIKTAEDLKQNAVSAQTILAMMEKENNGMNLLILDACRDNPYQGSDKNLTRGLKRIEPPMGALVALAAAEGEPALDGDGYYGLYTKHLLKALQNAKTKRLDDVFMDVYNSVLTASEGKQRPWYQVSMRKPFCVGNVGIVECPKQ